MKTLIYSAAVVALMTASPVLAADLMVSPEPAASADWSGLYIGGHAGWATGAASDSLECPLLDEAFSTDTYGTITGVTGMIEGTSIFLPLRELCQMSYNDAEFYVGNSDADYGGGYMTSQTGDTSGYFSDSWMQDPLDSVNGWLAGGQIGYLLQSGNIVYGAEVNASLMNLRDTGRQNAETNYSYDFYLRTDITEELSVDWMTTAVGRLGIAVGDNVLLSANAGLALAGVRYSNSDVVLGTWEDEGNFAGWTAGLQGDLRLTDNISVFAAYSYAQLYDLAFDGTIDGPWYRASGAAEYDLTVQTIKTGFNYHFN